MLGLRLFHVRERGSLAAPSHNLNKCLLYRHDGTFILLFFRRMKRSCPFIKSYYQSICENIYKQKQTNKNIIQVA